jgi:hypothetical protein
VRIRVNGEEYASWDEVPEELRSMLRAALPDSDHNGVPDVMEGKAEPGEQRYSGSFVVRRRSKITRVSRTTARPGFRFTMTGSEVQAVPPRIEADTPPARPPTPPTSATPEGPILLNGVEVGPDGQPLRRKPWWRRG